MEKPLSLRKWIEAGKNPDILSTPEKIQIQDWLIHEWLIKKRIDPHVAMFTPFNHVIQRRKPLFTCLCGNEVLKAHQVCDDCKDIMLQRKRERMREMA